MRIDWWTLALQTVNVLILIWILARFFFRPIADFVAKRQEEANKLLTDAAAARQEAASVRTEANQARAEIGAQRDHLIAEARKAAQTEKQNLLAQASQEAAKLRSEAEAAIARERSAAQQAIIDRASDLSVEIAQRLLERLPSSAALEVFLNGLCRKLGMLSPEESENFKASAKTGHAIEVVTAAPLSNDDSKRIREALTQVFGLELPFEFHDDPTIIAGIELRSRNTIVRNSWRADLDRIRKELSGDEQVHQS